MELRFADQRLQRLAESAVRSDTHFGTRDGALLRQRLCELMAVDNLAIAAAVPTLDLKPFPSGAEGFVVTVRPRLRLLFEIAGAARRLAGNGEVDLTTVETIRLLAIEECDEP